MMGTSEGYGLGPPLNTFAATTRQKSAANATSRRIVGIRTVLSGLLIRRRPWRAIDVPALRSLAAIQAFCEIAERLSGFPKLSVLFPQMFNLLLTVSQGIFGRLGVFVVLHAPSSSARNTTTNSKADATRMATTSTRYPMHGR
jgi:hypothetical protein